jgi:hypothetical protein
MSYCAIAAFLIAIFQTGISQSDHPAWPPPPDQARVVYIDEIKCADLKLKATLFGKLKRLVAGTLDIERISLPFDILKSDRSLFMTCQNIPYLVSLDPDKLEYRLYTSEDLPLKYPIGLCAGNGDVVYVTDSENGTVYRFHDGRLEPFIISGLSRPTGISANSDLDRIMVIDTGDHKLKLFDFDGNFIRMIGSKSIGENGFNYPTFASTMGNRVLINDALNYRIKLFDWEGNFISAFGAEGEGVGTFSRPKGIAVDSEDHVYVVDNLFDNIQVFNEDGRLLLVIGSGGQKPGEFWSPSGIDIANDTIYVADTFNNRVQILKYLGGKIR